MCILTRYDIVIIEMMHNPSKISLRQQFCQHYLAKPPFTYKSCLSVQLVFPVFVHCAFPFVLRGWHNCVADSCLVLNRKLLLLIFECVWGAGHKNKWIYCCYTVLHFIIHAHSNKSTIHHLSLQISTQPTTFVQPPILSPMSSDAVNGMSLQIVNIGDKQI